MRGWRVMTQNKIMMKEIFSGKLLATLRKLDCEYSLKVRNE